MKKIKDKEFDDLFKKRLEDPVYETGFLEGDWKALEQMLDEPKKRRGIVFWLPILSSAAALLIFFGLWFFTPKIAPHNSQKKQVAVIREQKNTDLSKGQVKGNAYNKNSSLTGAVNNNHRQVTAHETAEQNAGGNAKKELAANDNTKQAGNLQRSKDSRGKPYSRQLSPAINDNNIKQAGNLNRNKNSQDAQYSMLRSNTKNDNAYKDAIIPNDVRREGMTLIAVNHDLLTDKLSGANRLIALTPVESRDIVGAYKPVLSKSDKGFTKSGFAKHPQFALTFIGAPEFNSVNSIAGSKSGTNLGLLFSAGLFKNLTVSSGASYSIKPYNTNFANYHTTYAFKTDPSIIEADCRVLDIPVNVDYQLYNKHRNKFSIGSGLSSYIMLHEKYQYYYADPNAKGPSSYTVPQTNKYFFGILNLQATYTRQVNSKVGLSIQPYMKLPLTNIGYSQVRLQTAGVAVGLSWNLNSLTKP